VVISSYPDINVVLRPSNSIMLTTFASVTVVVVCHSI